MGVGGWVWVGGCGWRCLVWACGVRVMYVLCACGVRVMYVWCACGVRVCPCACECVCLRVRVNVHAGVRFLINCSTHFFHDKVSERFVDFIDLTPYT